ncbi:MAG: PIN domain-containing protein [Candidatus Hydrogenedentales bacterium]|jgi:predicted nucleic acid-binding protein
MKPLRVYLDTSVLGGCCDTEFSEDSLRVINAIRVGRLKGIVSAVVLAELDAAPENVRRVLSSLPANHLERVELTNDVYDLREAYLQAGILSPSRADDALHVAAATSARADAIVSWNFRHIVRLDKIKGFNKVNLEYGYGYLTIVSPKEVIVDVNEE